MICSCVEDVLEKTQNLLDSKPQDDTKLYLFNIKYIHNNVLKINLF